MLHAPDKGGSLTRIHQKFSCTNPLLFEMKLSQFYSIFYSH
jgi:hypothetical protein